MSLISQCYPNRPRVPDNSEDIPMAGGSVVRMEEQHRARENPGASTSGGRA